MFMGCSRGCFYTSETPLLNSGSMSKKRALLWESDISPGCGYDPPPTRATSVIVYNVVFFEIIVLGARR